MESGASWKRTGPGGSPGLQIRCAVRRASLVGSIPMRFRQYVFDIITACLQTHDCATALRLFYKA